MLIEVALPLPMPRTFTYRSDDRVEPGTRVEVPFGSRRLVGWVTGPTVGEPETTRVRPVRRVLEGRPSADPQLLQLSRWVADYYLSSQGLVLRAALPNPMTDAAADPVKTQRVLRLTRELPSLTLRDEVFGRAYRQRECFEFVEAAGGAAPVPQLTDQGFSYAVTNGLVERDVAEIIEEEVERDPFAAIPTRKGPLPPLTDPQERALTPLLAAARRDGGTFLLRGVTGSGKTRVYVELLREVVAEQGRGAIVLVPEIALTPQTVDRFRSRFGDDVAVLHSALSEGERYDAWRALRAGERRIAVGARSAVFAPVRELGAIVVDEEHESSYKQGEAPRYHAREVAIMRARMAGAICLLGSATPALESWANVAKGKFTLLELPDRVEGRPLPSVRVVDLRQRTTNDQRRTTTEQRPTNNQQRTTTGTGPGGAGVGAARQGDGSGGRGRPDGPQASGSGARSGDLRSDPSRPRDSPPDAPRSGGTGSGGTRSDTSRSGRSRVLSGPLEAGIRERLAVGEQTILLLNRRGYASFVQCRDCGHVWQCDRCNVSLTYHRTRRRLICHYCFHEEPRPERCTECGAGNLSFRGLGTEQVERIVTETFPTARVARMDVDTTSGKWAHHEILGRVERREVDILLGTQMIAKGLDFPDVTLVGVINADVGMNLPDFRAGERTFQLLTQVAGRAGRGDRPGQVLIQTALPNHYAIRRALEHDYIGFAERELEERREPAYPPHTRLANVVVSGTEEVQVQEAAEALAGWTARAIRTAATGAVRLLGPAPCAIDRIRDRWRWHLLLRSRSARKLGAVCSAMYREYGTGSGATRIIIDRDPVALL